MTKEKIKFLIDNRETIFNEIAQVIEDLGVQLPDFDSSGSVKNIYEELYKYSSEIFNKYNIDYDSFACFFIDNKEIREQILGIDENNQLLRDVIDIYGDNAYEILGCNSTKFELSEIDGILSGENNQEYEQFYIKVLKQKCEKANNLEELSSILLSTKPKYVKQELIEKFLENPDKIIFSSLRTGSFSTANDVLLDFINTAPSIIINGNTVKALVNRLSSISDISILERIPPELFDEDFSRYLLENTSRVSEVFELIPEQVKSKNMYELATSKAYSLLASLPEKKIDDNMTDAEYSKWCNDLIIGVMKNNPSNIKEIFSDLRDSQKNVEICMGAIELLKPEEMERLLGEIPKESRSRQIYEALLKKSETIIKHIPDETFEEGLSQEEYKTWVDDVIIQRILETKDISKLKDLIPREKITERVWDYLLDKCEKTNTDKKIFGLNSIPIQNITVEMCERALQELGDYQIEDIPSIDKKIDLISNGTLKKEYEKWIKGFSEEEKQLYREWHERKVIDYMKRHNGVCLFEYERIERDYIRIPTEAISINILNTYLQMNGPYVIDHIPIPNEFTNYNEQYEDIILSAISMLKENDNGDFLDKIPAEYRTDKIILEAIRKSSKYLDYVDIDRENFDELLKIGYKRDLSEKQIELIKKFAKNNSSLFSTLKIDILKPEVIDIIGENSIEKIARYKNIQDTVTSLSEDKDELTVFGFTLENLKQDSLFLEPLIEKLSKSITTTGIIKHEGVGFLSLVADRIQDTKKLLTEEEKVIISYLALNPQEACKIKSYDEILNYVENKNAELDRVINFNDITLIDAKNAYLERIVGMDYDSVMDLINKYGNDTENLLAKYEGKELETYNQKSEKEALEIIIKLKALIEEKNLDKIRQAYKETVEKDDKTKSFERYKQSTILDNTLKKAYGRDITQTLSEHTKENSIESIEHTEDGQEYVVRKMQGPFNRMVSLLNAYRKSGSKTEGDMYDRWNTAKMANNHALCFSFINESNPGTAMIVDYNINMLKQGIIISVSDFNPEAVTAVAPYDLCSDSRMNTTITGRQQRFYTADNLQDRTRGRYSEVVIEIQDVSEGITGYKKIQPTSIICFEKIDEDSINAAIELSKKLGRTIPIELIDRRELATQTRTEIDSLLEQFKSEDTLHPELVEEIITKFNNVRNANRDSSLRDELLGEEYGKQNPEAIFNKVHLNRMLLECIEVASKKIEEGQVQEGLETIEQIKQYIKNEREKNELMPTMFAKQIMAGIDLDIDYRLDEIQRMYGKQEAVTEARNESIELLKRKCELSSHTFEIIWRKN